MELHCVWMEAFGLWGFPGCSGSFYLTAVFVSVVYCLEEFDLEESMTHYDGRMTLLNRVTMDYYSLRRRNSQLLRFLYDETRQVNLVYLSKKYTNNLPLHTPPKKLHGQSFFSLSMLWCGPGQPIKNR
jgi:hypothetical protein